jgi:DNA-directed RNA polymerase specialized sigma24 family protein
MNAADYYKANVGLVHSVSKKGYGRLRSAGVGMDYEDIFQEMSIVFLKAYSGFDESQGFKFSTYYFRAAYNKLNTWAQKLIDERLEHGVVSIQELNHSEDGENSLEDVLMVDATTPEAQYRVTQFLSHVNDSLTPLASLILAWVLQPPPQLMTEVKKAEANAQYGRTLGYNSRCMVNISPRYIAKFIQMISDVKQPEVDRALKEIERLRRIDAKQFIGA